MTWCCRSLVVGILALGVPAGTVFGQKGVEGGVHGLATFADFTLAGGGLHGGLRPGGRARIALTATAGSADGEFVLRGELTGQFQLNPASFRHGFYAGGGVAGLTGPDEQGYLVLLLGWETRPGGSSGWAFEAGMGGGVRLLVGYRWRRLTR